MRFHERVTRVYAILLAAAFIPAAFAATATQPELSAKEIIARSSKAIESDFKEAPNYGHTERDLQDGTDKTYRVRMVDGSPYKELIAVNGKPLSEQQQKQQQQQLKQEIAKRKAQSSSERKSRIASYEQDRRRDHTMMAQLSAAFDFKLLKKTSLDSFDVYVLKATPKKDYNPPNMESQVLPGMQGTMWIDQKTFQWVKVTAHVIQPVSIMGFLAKVQPGTKFELEKRPVNGNYWAPSHFSMHSNAKVLGLFTHTSSQNQTFYDFQPAQHY